MTGEVLSRLLMHQVDRDSGVPLYVQIRNTIRGLINRGHLEVGDQLPGESDLASIFGVSRMTVRHALNELAQGGIIRRVQGTGTLVTSRNIVREYNRLTSFYEDAQRVGLEPSSTLLAREVISCSDDIANSLALDGGAPVIHLTRLRYTATRMVALHEVYVSQALCPWLLEEDLENQSLYQLYESYGLPLRWGHQRIEARAAHRELAKALQVERGSPVLYLERTIYTDGDVPVEWVRAFSPGDIYAIEMRLDR